MTTRQNSTARDAYLRVQDARAGFLIDASDEFLHALMRNLESWIEDIADERAVRAQNRRLQQGGI